MYSDVNLSDELLYDRLLAVINEQNVKDVDSLLIRFETGIYIFTNAYIKERYDYLLHYGWVLILSNPLKVLYVMYIIIVVGLQISIKKILGIND